jgi:hypothetical protein
MAASQKIEGRSIPRVKETGEQLLMRLKKQRKCLLFNQKIIYFKNLKKSLKKWLT